MIGEEYAQQTRGGSDRRNVLRAAAGLGLTLPVFGGVVAHSRAQQGAQSLPWREAVLAEHASHGAEGGHGGHAAGLVGEPPEGFRLYNPRLEKVTPGRREIEVVAVDATVPVAKDVMFTGWTYDGTIPGRTLRAVEGDTIDFTLRIDPNTLIGHSIDFHSARTAPNVNYRTISQGEELSFSFVAEYPGVFMYHCGTPPILMHLGAGMYGAMIVDPKEGWSEAHEFSFVQSEFYLTDDGTGSGVMATAYTKMLGQGTMDFTVFNGYANQYVENPITVGVGEPMRVFIMNAGPNAFSTFHVVGTIFDRVYMNGNPKNMLVGMQSVSIGPGDGAVVEFTLPEPGEYAFVNHGFGHATQGAVGLFIAE